MFQSVELVLEVFLYKNIALTFTQKWTVIVLKIPGVNPFYQNVILGFIDTVTQTSILNISLYVLIFRWRCFRYTDTAI
jgi:hypothetical protein